MSMSEWDRLAFVGGHAGIALTLAATFQTATGAAVALGFAGIVAYRAHTLRVEEAREQAREQQPALEGDTVEVSA